MKQVFSDIEINMIKSIVIEELQVEKQKSLTYIKTKLYMLLGIGYSILTFVIMSKILDKGASKLYKRQLKHKSRKNTKEKSVNGY